MKKPLGVKQMNTKGLSECLKRRVRLVGRRGFRTRQGKKGRLYVGIVHPSYGVYVNGRCRKERSMMVSTVRQIVFMLMVISCLVRLMVCVRS